MPRRAIRGASLLETLLVLALVLVFMLLATQRIIELRHAAERVGVQNTIATLQSALGMQMAVIALQQGMPGLAALHHSNPMDLLDPAPVNYQAEQLSQDEQAPGSWFFDREARQLVYRLRYPQRLQNSDTGQPDRIRLQLQVFYQDGQVQRVAIEPLHDYRWLVADRP
jgi:competence protein ComGC